MYDFTYAKKAFPPFFLIQISKFFEGVRGNFLRKKFPHKSIFPLFIEKFFKIC